MHIHDRLISKEDADLVVGMMKAYPELTETELRIAAFVERRFTSREIAGLLGCSVRNIDNHRYRMGKKMKARGSGL